MKFLEAFLLGLCPHSIHLAFLHGSFYVIQHQLLYDLLCVRLWTYKIDWDLPLMEITYW